MMNLKNEILNELSKDDFKDDFIKIRYIYLKVCETFSYDTRFMYADQDLKDKIYNKKIDINNVEEYEIICYSFARILVDVLTLYNFDAEIVRENDGVFSHVYVIVKYKNYVLKLDPTKRHDNTRVKLQSNTLDFVSLYYKDMSFNQRLKDADDIIMNCSKKNKIDLTVYYNDSTITKLVKTVEDSAKERGISEIELFFEKMEYIILLVNTRKDLKRYDDIDYYYSYLIKKFELNKNGEKHVKPAVFFKNGDKSMKDIINITLIEYKDLPPVFFLMMKEEENYKMREIDKEETIELLKNYNCPLVQYYFEQKAIKMPSDKIIK